ncbi:hypothetical protein [Pseudaestuariivita sp.]|uniref:hypothetical protein n=1 Tax=Pseudaestuariivita sp. TaxID=2211669 RepID=UPI004059F981
MTHVSKNPLVLRDVFLMVAQDVQRATSLTDLKQRLANKGYGLRRTPDGPVLVTMPHGLELGPLPQV